MVCVSVCLFAWTKDRSCWRKENIKYECVCLYVNVCEVSELRSERAKERKTLLNKARERSNQKKKERKKVLHNERKAKVVKYIIQGEYISVNTIAVVVVLVVWGITPITPNWFSLPSTPPNWSRWRFAERPADDCCQSRPPRECHRPWPGLMDGQRRWWWPQRTRTRRRKWLRRWSSWRNYCDLASAQVDTIAAVADYVLNFSKRKKHCSKHWAPRRCTQSSDWASSRRRFGCFENQRRWSACSCTDAAVEGGEDCGGDGGGGGLAEVNHGHHCFHHQTHQSRSYWQSVPAVEETRPRRCLLQSQCTLSWCQWRSNHRHHSMEGPVSTEWTDRWACQLNCDHHHHHHRLHFGQWWAVGAC